MRYEALKYNKKFTLKHLKFNIYAKCAYIFKEIVK